MNKMNEYIKILVSKYVSGTLSDDEAVRLAKWIKMSGDNAELFRSEVRTMEKNRTTTSDAVEFWNRLAKDKFSGKDSTGNDSAGKSFRRTWTKYAGAVAAAVAVIVSVSILIMNIDKKDIPEQDIVAEHVQTQENAAPARKESLIYTAAAGEKKTVILPDNTKVMLNSGAKLMLSDDFNETERRVDLDGEAFFDVARNPEKLFIVCCRDNEYIVRGTSFNVSSYVNDRFSIVTLHTGRLEARVHDDVIMLKPGDELRIDRNMNQITKQTVDISNSAKWRDSGQLSFSSLPLKYVANQVSHKYNVKINVHSSIEDIVYDGCLDRESLQDALRLISMTSPVELSVTEFKGEYYISKKSTLQQQNH